MTTCSPPGEKADEEYVEIDPTELRGIFAAPGWLRDLGIACWLLVGVAAALGVIIPWTRKTPKNPGEALGVCREINKVLGVSPLEPTTFAQNVHSFGIVEDASVKDTCKKIDDARTRKDYAAADQLRQQLIDAGYQVQTTRDGTFVQQQLA